MPVPVKTAADLRRWHNAEFEQFYLVFDRNVCVFNQEFTMTKAVALQRYEKILIELMDAYDDAKTEARKREVADVFSSFLIIPYRIH